MTLKNKIQDSSKPVILYELIPPAVFINHASLNAYVECALDLLNSSSITLDAINVPEIRDEELATGNRTEEYVSKIDPGHFAQLIRQSSKRAFEVILNHSSVYETLEEQKKWLAITYDKLNIRYLILVGGSQSITYPGPNVNEFSEYIKKNYPKEFFCGGIVIPTRRHSDPLTDEPARMLNKMRSGIEFFTSQIIYEAESMIQLIRDYYELCLQNNVTPKRIFLSFAPISTKKNLEFLRWLGAVVPEDTEEKLFETDIGVGWRSAKIAEMVLLKILSIVKEEDIKVPLGLNIEHITRHNFEISHVFIERLGKIYIESFRS